MIENFYKQLLLGVFDLEPKANDRVYYALDGFINKHFIPTLKNKGIKVVDNDYTVSWDDRDYIDIYVNIINSIDEETVANVFLEVENLKIPQAVMWSEGTSDESMDLRLEDWV